MASSQLVHCCSPLSLCATHLLYVLFHALDCRYGLTSSQAGRAQVVHVRVSLDQFELWCTSIIQLNRPQHLQMLRSCTMEGTRAEILRFLGWCLKYGQVTQPRLCHMLNPHLLVGFLAFVRARGINRSNLVSYVTTTIKVVTWLQVTGQLSNSDTSRVPQYMCWLHNLQHQLTHHISPQPSPSLTQLISQGRWMQPQQLMRCIDQVYKQARVVVLNAAAAGFTTDSLPRPKVVQVMEALFCCLFYGYIPPLRPSVAISLQRPGYTGVRGMGSAPLRAQVSCVRSHLLSAVEPCHAESRPLHAFGVLPIAFRHHLIAVHACIMSTLLHDSRLVCYNCHFRQQDQQQHAAAS